MSDEPPEFRTIDGHAHLFPDEIRLDRHRFRARDPWFSHLFDNPLGGMATAEELVASMDVAGIQRTVVCGWPWRDQGICALHNDYLAETASRYPDRISWMGNVNPLNSLATAEMERCVDRGAVGIGELNADAQGFEWQIPISLGALGEACVALDIPILMHCSEPTGHAYPGKGTATPDRILKFFELYPELRVVAAHWGGGLPFYELMPEVAVITANVVYDTAASAYLYRDGVFATVERVVGAERILYGSDFPVIGQQRSLNRARAAISTSADQAAILGNNAMRIFGLDDKG